MLSPHRQTNQPNLPSELSYILLTSFPTLPILNTKEKKNKLGFGVGIKGPLRLVTDNAFTSTEGVIKKMKNTVSTFTQGQVFFFPKGSKRISSPSAYCSLFRPTPSTSIPFSLIFTLPTPLSVFNSLTGCSFTVPVTPLYHFRHTFYPKQETSHKTQGYTVIGKFFTNTRKP